MSIEYRNEKFTPDLPNVSGFSLFTYNSFYNNLCDCTWMSTKWQINAFIIVTIFSQPIICSNSLCTTLKLFDIFFKIYQRYQKKEANIEKLIQRKSFCDAMIAELKLCVFDLSMPA